jgi:hypothetical protein
MRKIVKKRVDWDAMEPEYRAGVLSNMALADRYDCTESAVRDHAKKFGWTRNLADKVRESISENLLRGELRDAATPRNKDDQVVHQAAAAGTQIVLRHRDSIARQQRIKERLEQELEKMTAPGEMKGLTPLAAAVKISEALARTTSLLTGLERQAFNLDAQPSAGVPASEAIKAFHLSK